VNPAPPPRPIGTGVAVPNSDAPVPPPPVQAEEREEPFSPERSAPGPALDRHMHVPMSALYLSLAGILLIVLLVWGIAFRLGKSEEKAKSDKILGAAAGQTVLDPLKAGNPSEQIPASPNLVGTAPVVIDLSNRKPIPNATAGKGVSKGPPASDAPQAAPAATGAAAFGTDPRQSGLNYLLIEGRLDRESAERIQQFLSENGVPAFAVVDDRGGAANNGSLYLVGVNRGLSREEYRTQVKTDLESQVRKLGQTWQSQHRGTTSFSQTSWERKK
jgi:hypothetical protein